MYRPEFSLKQFNQHSRKTRRSSVDGAAFIPILFVILICPSNRLEPTHAASHGKNEPEQHRLGEVNFPNSCTPSVHSKINDGVAFLHLFEYRQAADTFRRISTEEPQCAMAYWGKAMSLYEPLWSWPDRNTFAEGLADIEMAEAQTTVTPREHAYIEVARVFYQKAPQWNQVSRIKAFSEAWEKLYRQYPDDVDGGAFYGLSLVTLAEIGVDEIDNRKRAITVLDALFRAAPEDPGPAHYLIHAADTAELAPKGLDAAREFAHVAPDSAHALHMPSHIFVRLGLWRDSIESNRASAAAAAAATRAGLADIRYEIHAMDFLNYSYLQAGDATAATRVTEDLTSVRGATAQQIAFYQADFRARAALELHQWKSAQALTVPQGEPLGQETTVWVRTIGAARNGDVAEAQGNLVRLEEIVAVVDRKWKRRGPRSNDDDIRVAEARSWLSYAQGHTDEALRGLRHAADSEGRARVEALSMPAREMLADMLLASHEASEALREYEQTLRESPKRFDALYGAARAAESMGQPNEARKYFAMLIGSALPSADRPELEQARAYLAAK
jgi:tetratricopeptide (TPR) repeat protein